MGSDRITTNHYFNYLIKVLKIHKELFIAKKLSIIVDFEEHDIDYVFCGNTSIAL